MSIKNVFGASCIALSTLVSVSAFAGDLDQGLYLGGQIGTAQSTTEFEGSGDFEDNSGLTTFYMGYKFSPMFALEGTLSATELDGANSAFRDGSYVFTTFTPKVMLPITDTVSMYAKGGLAGVSYLVDTDDNIYGDDVASWSGDGYTAGVGAELSVGAGVFVRLAYDFLAADLELNDEDDFPGLGDDVDVELSQFSVGVHYQF